MTRKTKLLDIAEALGVSTGTVHRALHNHPGVSTMTKTRVLQMAKTCLLYTSPGDRAGSGEVS